MDPRDDVFPAENRCEVCGGELGDEIMIQEFADGSLARLCPECAAGAALDEHYRAEEDSAAAPWPVEPPEPSAERPTEFDPLEKTRELLMPVTDLIGLQAEMQSALERLAASLERFATEILTESQGRTAVESRLRTLERELDKTRARLQETEFLLASTVETSPGALAGLVEDAAATVSEAPQASPDRVQQAAAEPQPTAPEPELMPGGSPTTASTSKAPSPLDEKEPVIEGPTPSPTPTAPPGPEVAAAGEQPHGTGFRIDEVQAAQRYYNESPFVSRIRDVQNSLGKPKANLACVPGEEPRAILTIAWDIVWYQYLIDLHRDLPASRERVVLHREGMDLDELPYYFKERNAVINDDGKLDASELEVRLLSDPSALITEMTPEEMQALEDATAEIWDGHAAPEFKWDD